MLTPNKNKNDLAVIFLGFILILIISGLFFFKNRLSAQKNAGIKSNVDTALQNFSSITSDDLAKKIKAGESLAILDLRDTDVFNDEHILDSKNIDSSNIENETSHLNKNTDYFIVDDLGLTPKEIQVMSYLKENGYAKIAYLEGGITQWENGFEPTIRAGNPSFSSDQAKVSYITGDELKAALPDKATHFFVVDLGKKDEYAQGHIPTAVNIPLDELENRRHEIPVGAKTVLYDENGMGAFQGAVRLFDAGVLNIYTLSDGFDAWKKKGYEVIH